MKKIKLLLVLLSSTIISFSQSVDDNLIGTFLSSPEYHRVVRTFNDLGDIDFEKSTVIFIDDNTNKPELNIVFTKDGVVSAVIKSIKLKSGLSNVLPGDEKYVMCLLDYRSYVSNSKSGEIRVIDLNYENHVAGAIFLNNSELVNLIVTDIPDKIMAKYSNLLKKSDLSESGRNHYCDLNQNGNVTFSECFTCMLRSCFGNQQCAVLCGLTNIGGGMIGSVSGTCSASMATSCVFISIWY